MNTHQTLRMPFSKAMPSPPPAYQPVDINTAICKACEVPEEHDEASRQLHRFLTFCLAVDYNLVHDWDEVYLRKEWRFWLDFSYELALHYHRLILANTRAPFYGGRVPPIKKTDATWQKVRSCIIRPAIAIGVPPGRSEANSSKHPPLPPPQI